MMMEQDAKRVRRQARNPSRNQEMMMEQDTKKIGRQAPDLTLPRTRKWWWNRMPKEYGDKPRNPSHNQERMMEQDTKGVGRQAPEP